MSQTSSRWAVALPRDSTHAGRLRLTPGIEVCLTDAALWLRGRKLDDTLAHRLRLLPGASRFTVLDDGQLLAAEAAVPKGYEPSGPWQPLERWLSLDLPTAGWPGQTPTPVPLRLVRSNDSADATLLLASLEHWIDYGSMAPQARLERLSFAVAEDGRVLVRGSPLPPLAGERWVDREGIATPTGWTWSPAVEPEVVREILRLEPHDLALLHVDGSWEQVAAGDLVRAMRSAIRLTAEAMQHAD